MLTPTSSWQVALLSTSAAKLLIQSGTDKNYSTIINAAAYTAVDAAETAEGRAAAWAVNVTAVARLARTAVEHDLKLLHISYDYVSDGEHAKHMRTSLYHRWAFMATKSCR